MIAFVFPGQGSQAVGMGKALADRFGEARAVFEAADDALGEKLSKLCFEGPDDQLKLTANAQPAILATSIAAHAVFATRGKSPAYVAGHSLGEYSALVAAGAMGLADAVRAVRERGRFMQEAVPQGQGAMAAVLGLEPDKVHALCAASAHNEVVSVANLNSPEQTVIAGHATAVERAAAAIKEAGAKRVVALPVSAPFHCALMQPVQPRLREVLSQLTWKAPSCPVVANVTARPNSDPARIVDLLVDQVTAPVRWIECVRAMRASGVDRMVELGPGKVLSGLIRRIDPAMLCANAEDLQSMEKAWAF